MYHPIQLSTSTEVTHPKVSGGNSDEFYFKEVPTTNQRCWIIHNDVSKVKWIYNRYHHMVNYIPLRITNWNMWMGMTHQRIEMKQTYFSLRG